MANATMTTEAKSRESHIHRRGLWVGTVMHTNIEINLTHSSIR